MKHDYSYTSLLSFLNNELRYAVHNPATVRNLKNSTIRVFDEALNEEEKMDTRKIDLDIVLDRFIKTSFPPVQLSNSTLSNYRSRISRALNEFFSFVDEPTRSLEQQSLFEDSISLYDTLKGRSSEAKGINLVKDNAISIPVPLKNGFIAKLVIPRTFSEEDLSRIHQILKLYVQE